jgi:hypothetical protein
MTFENFAFDSDSRGPTPSAGGDGVQKFSKVSALVY